MSVCYEPTTEELIQIHDHMRGRFKTRNRLLWMLGCYTGYRISELLSLSIADIWDGAKPLEKLVIQRKYLKKKTPREIPPPIMPILHKLIEAWIKDLASMGFIHKSSKVFVTKYGRPLRRQSFYDTIKSACMIAGIKADNIGTHSMRKRFVMQNYRQLKADKKYANDASGLFLQLRKITGHKTVESLIKYIRIEEDRAEMLMRKALETPDIAERLGYDI